MMIKKVISLLLYSLIFLLPFVFFPGLADPFEFPKAVFFVFIVTLSIGLYVVGIITKDINEIKFNYLHMLFILFFAIGILSSLLGVDFSQSFWGQYYRYQGLLSEAALFLFLFLISQKEALGVNRSVVYKAISFSATAVAVLIIFQAIAFFLWHLPVYTYNGRMTATLGNPNFAAGFLVLSFPFVFFSFRQGAWTWLWAILFLLAIFLTQSRGGLLGFLLFWFLSWFLGQRNWRWILLGLALALLVFNFFPHRSWSPFENRFLIWSRGIEAFEKRPLLGWGVEHFETAFNSTLVPGDYDLSNIRVDKAHNLVLEILVTRGVLGLASWLAIVLLVTKKLWDKGRAARPFLFSFLLFIFLGQLNVLNINEYLFFYLAAHFFTFRE
jgi:O-antigen ligase